jgi:WD40 repeat protein
VIKYSPKEDRLAVGSHDNNIYILKVEGDQYTLEGACKAHQSFITNIDWSCDGNYIHTNCGAYEYLFFDVNTRTQVKSGGSMLKDEQWASYTVKLGWWVQGIFPPAKSGNHVNGVHRSHGKDVIATGDNWGLVNLYRNPAVKGGKYSAYRAHSSHVVRVLFDEKDEFVYSVGGYDKTMMMWKVI